MRQRTREQAADARDIGQLPKVKNKKRRDSCERDLRKFLLTYFKDSFQLEFSDDHERIIKDIEQRVLGGALKAIAMPRGSGKTTILIRAAIWATSYGHRSFVVLVEADGEAAKESMDVIKIEWETNQLLLEDFPEIAAPIRALEGITQRANAQTYKGQRTLISWTAKELIYPTIPGSKASGTTIRCSGILGRIRGMQKLTADGETLRPDFVLINDPQTDISARSELECAKREKVVNGAILGLGGPGKRIAGFAAITVIRQGDLADRMLNHKISPKWHGDKCKLVYKWPDDKEHWDEYLNIRAEEIANGNDEHPRATAYYRMHRKVMDAGAVVGWQHRFFPHEISAIQHAFGLRADNPDTYDAEYDQEPKAEFIADTTLRVPTSDELCLRIWPTHARGELPIWCEYLTLGIDVQENSLWWVLLGTSTDFKAIVVDYGVYPEQGLDYVTNAELQRTLSIETKIKRPADAIIEGLKRLCDKVNDREFIRDDGTVLTLNQIVIDSGHRGEAIYRFAQEMRELLPVMPSKGFGIGARKRPWESEQKKPGERYGLGWRMPPLKRLRTPRNVHVDTNRWKTFLCDCWNTPLDESGAWAFFKGGPQRHRLIADNCSSEFATQTEGHGRKVYEWQLKPGRDNHLLDALILAGVGASINGAKAPSEEVQKIKKARRKVDMAAARQAAQGKGPGKARKSLAQMRAEARGS